MPRPIVLTEEIKQKAVNDFSAMLDTVKMSDGKLRYSQSWEYKDCSAIVWLTQEAYRKIVALVMNFASEVAWHGTVTRVGNNEFVIEDIFVYPQEVTGSTVNTDQKAYSEWLYSLDDNTFNQIRMQGHSHVNMGVSPSSVDDKHRQQILDQLEPDMFYVFMIWNKSLTVHTLIYDMARNILYEDNDVSVKLIDDEDMVDFLADANKKVQKPTVRTTPTNKKNKGGSKKQKIAQIGLSGVDVDFDEVSAGEHEDCSLCGMCASYELEPIGCRADYRSPYDPYGLGWRKI